MEAKHAIALIAFMNVIHKSIELSEWMLWVDRNSVHVDGIIPEKWPCPVTRRSIRGYAMSSGKYQRRNEN